MRYKLWTACKYIYIITKEMVNSKRDWIKMNKKGKRKRRVGGKNASGD